MVKLGDVEERHELMDLIMTKRPRIPGECNCATISDNSTNEINAVMIEMDYMPSIDDDPIHCTRCGGSLKWHGDKLFACRECNFSLCQNYRSFDEGWVIPPDPYCT